MARDDFRKARWYAVRPATNRKPATYRCPLCGGHLPALSEHLLVLPEGDSSRRRHAHTACIQRARRDGRLPLREEVEPVRHKISRMHVEAEITVGRPRSEVFQYLADAERLPEYVTDFAWVRRSGAGEVGRGTEYSYKMSRGAEGTFEWTEFEPSSRLAWHGPPARSGPGSMEPAGWWELSDENGGTRVRFVMTPKPGGLFKLLSPLMARSMRKGSTKAVALFKERLEGGAGPS